MKLEVGMYVRTLNGIVKIDKIQDNVMKDTKGHLHYGDFVKASYKIIDILEEGDYVDGRLVCKNDEENYLYLIGFDADGNFYEDSIKDIKSIVTKEMFSSMEYRLGDDK